MRSSLWYVGVVLLVVGAAGTLLRAEEKLTPKDLDLTTLIGGAGEGDKESEDSRKALLTKEIGEGDRAKFTIRADDSEDISTLTEGDWYRTEGKTYFKVVEVHPKGHQGGHFVVERIYGKGEPDAGEKFMKDQGKGPEIIHSRVTLIDYYIMGGPFLHPTALVGLMTLVLTVNGIWLYRLRRQAPASFVTKARSCLEAGDVEGFQKAADNTPGLLAAVCRSMLDRFDVSTTAETQTRMNVSASAYITRLRIPVRLLNLAAVAAPLLGLLGTIIGMILVFEGVAGAGGADKAKLLASGLRIKLFSTALALMVAIPALFAYYILNQWLNSNIGKIEVIADEFLHRMIGIRKQAEAESEEGGAEAAEDEEAEEAAEEEEAPAKKPALAKAGKPLQKKAQPVAAKESE